ncbi:Rho GTPase-activating protein 100F [Blattella germanica]|nr:Rho GTPase-activating protein 100F [Blattella germanica]
MIAEFLKYKMDKPSSSLGALSGDGVVPTEPGVSGLLWVHLLAGRGLRSTTSSSAATTPSTPSGPPIGSSSSTGLRDLYCVLECDRVHKARTVVRTGDLVFDWDETFELDLVNNRELDLLIYSWDPQYRHKLCYKGSVHLASLLRESPIHQLALKIEPRGTLYLRLRHTDPHITFQRQGRPGSKSLTGVAALFGADLETVVTRESLTGGVPGGVATSVTLATQAPSAVPIIVRRCVEEVERRGLDIIGLYRLCGSATKKRILREAFERNARTVDLSPDNVPDINVITGVLKDYLRELPEPLFTKCLYQMMVDALSVCLPDDPEGNAKLMFSILDCLPKVNRHTLIFLMDHLALVVSQSERNKMSPQNLAICFGPVLMLQSEENKELDFNQPISVLKYLLEIWPTKSVVGKVSTDHQAIFSQTVREVFSPSLHLSAASQSSRLPSLVVSKPLAPAQPAPTAVGAVPWSLGRGARGTSASRGRKSVVASPAGSQQQVVVVSSPDSPTSEESSPSPSPETEEVKKPLGKSVAAGTVGRTVTLRKPGVPPKPPPPRIAAASGDVLQGANGLPSGSSTTASELVPNGTADDFQQQIQTPTSSTTTEDSRKEATAREADGEASDEEKEEDGDDEDDDEEEDRRMMEPSISLAIIMLMPNCLSAERCAHNVKVIIIQHILPINWNEKCLILHWNGLQIHSRFSEYILSNNTTAITKHHGKCASESDSEHSDISEVYYEETKIFEFSAQIPHPVILFITFISYYIMFLSQAYEGTEYQEVEMNPVKKDFYMLGIMLFVTYTYICK